MIYLQPHIQSNSESITGPVAWPAIYSGEKTMTDHKRFIISLYTAGKKKCLLRSKLNIEDHKR